MKRAFALGALIAVLWLGLPARQAMAQSGEHVVRPGETLYGIAAFYGVTAADMAAMNGISNYDLIYAGQRLTIPGGYKPSPGHAPAPGGSWQGRYVVKPGDSLYAIAWSTGSTISALMAANGLMNPDVIYAGQSLVVPGPGGYTPPHRPPSYECGYRHVVKPGDTLSAIAWRTGTTVYALARANGLGYPYVIYGGQALHIPCDGGSPKPPDHHPRPSPPKPRPTDRPHHAPAACARSIQIVQPREGERLRGTVYVVGTADIPDFQFYKLEYASGHRPLDSQFNSIGEETYQKVNDSLLGIWYVGNLGRGDYTLRLTAVDRAGQYPRPCDVRLHIGD